MPDDYLWEKNVQAGFDPEQGKWRLRNGQFADRLEVLGQRDPEGVYGGWATGTSMTPLSDALDNYERVILGGLHFNHLQAQAKQMEARAHADFMPPEILACMQLAEYYTNSEGDLWNTVIVPIQLSLRDIQVESSDTGVQKELEETYERINMNEVLEWIWICTEVYGNAYPLEVWDETGKELLGIVLLNPKYMKVGQQVSLTPQLFLSPQEGMEWGGDGWSDEALSEQIHPMVYHSFASNWNEQAAKGNDIPLDVNRCKQVNNFKLPWQRYAIPPVSRCFRPLSTRQIAEELQRATMEGFRNQLWHFKVGTDEHAASPSEISHVRGLVSDKMAGQRTGYLVTRHTVDVAVIAPAALDGMLANEFWLAQTLHIYRQRGLSLKIITGESPGQRGTDIEWDIEVFMERMKYPRRSLLTWEKHIRDSIAKSKGKGAWNDATTRSYMLLPDVQTKALVKDQLQPLRMAGLLSVQTLLEKLGYNYQTERERKEDELEDAELWMPVPSFAQATTFNTPKTTLEQTPGRPPGVEEKEPREKVEASIQFEADASFDAYLAETFNAFDELVGNPLPGAVDGFISELKTINAEHMLKFAKDGYNIGGGGFEVDPDWIRGAVNFVNGYADDFGDRLRAAAEAGQNLDNFRWNVYLYPQEGRHLAYMWGVQQAMKERGARGWRRVLHPERSETGPCDACISDSQIVHPIDEGFFEFHPNGVCTAQGVAYYVHPTLPIAEIPIPTKVTLPKMIREIIKKLGKIGKSVVRRIRTELER
jgi:hypothetical protein